MATVTVVDKDLGFARFSVDLKALSGRSVRIGIMGDDSIDGVAIVDYAMYNEFGTSRGIPARPFMGTTYARYAEDTGKFIEGMYDRLISGKIDPDTLLKNAGEYYQSKVQLTIRQAKSWAVPNDPKTIAMKGSSSPLIDTGRMVQSVRYEVT